MIPGYAGTSRFLRGASTGWSVSLISQTSTAAPNNTLISGLDLAGDGISSRLLPGITSQNQFGAGLTANALRALVAQFNTTIAAPVQVVSSTGAVTTAQPRTAENQVINPIVLPAKFWAGDSLLSQDVRLSRDIPIRERMKLSIMGEVFNIFNFANLTGYSAVLNQANFGQPSARVGQAFGSGAPAPSNWPPGLAFNRERRQSIFDRRWKSSRSPLL